METVLVTGTAGLIGSHVSQWLLDHTNTRVIGVDDFSCGLRSNVPKGLHGFYELTLGEGDLNAVFERERPDRVYHFASFAAECASPFMRMYSYKNVLMASVEVINAAINYDVRRLVCASSMSVYGESKEPPFDEADPLCPLDPYGLGKMCTELDIQIAGRQHGLQWTIVRPHNFFGEGQSYRQGLRNLFTIWFSRYLRGLPLRIYGTGEQRRAFSYVGDCLEPFYRAGFDDATHHEVINLGGVRDYSINEAAEIVKRILPDATFEYAEPRHEAFHAWSTWEKSERLLGFKHKTDLETGLRKLWAWIKEQPVGEPTEMEFEVTKGLYSYWQPTKKAG